MARPAGSELRLVLILVLAAAGLPGCLRGHGGASSLRYKFTVTRNGQPWFTIEGQFNGSTFVDYTSCSEKVKPIIVRGMKVNAIQAWNQQRPILKHVAEELRGKLLDPESQIGLSSLQGRMMCQQEPSGLTSASWEFVYDGQLCLRFYPNNRSWVEFHPKCRPLKQMLDRDRSMTDLLVRTSAGDCVKWLEQVSELQGEVLNTAAEPTSGPATANSAKVPDKPNMAPSTAAIIGCAFTGIFIVAGIICCVLYKKRKCCSRSEGVA